MFQTINQYTHFYRCPLFLRHSIDMMRANEYIQDIAVALRDGKSSSEMRQIHAVIINSVRPCMLRTTCVSKTF